MDTPVEAGAIPQAERAQKSLPLAVPDHAEYLAESGRLIVAIWRHDAESGKWDEQNKFAWIKAKGVSTELGRCGLANLATDTFFSINLTSFRVLG